MDFKGIVPLVLYDDQCYLCIKFAKVVNVLARRKLSLVGHYSSFGNKIRNEILDSNALEMFWFIDGKKAYGGRAALLPLLKAIIFYKGGNDGTLPVEESCDASCKTAKAVFIRSASLLTSSKTIKLSS